MDVRSTLAGMGYGQARAALRPDAQRLDAQRPDARPREGLVSAAVRSFADTIRTGETTAISSMQGGADTHALVLALAESQLAVETAVTLRDKVVEAYQEILRMPV